MTREKIISWIEWFLGWRVCPVCKVQAPPGYTDKHGVCMFCEEYDG